MLALEMKQPRFRNDMGKTESAASKTGWRTRISINSSAPKTKSATAAKKQKPFAIFDHPPISHLAHYTTDSISLDLFNDFRSAMLPQRPIFFHAIACNPL
ncbi:MAG TPA: hypothetical protein VGN23_04210 [Verrucomicrobiae bacterium]